MLAPSIFGMNDLFDDFGDVFDFHLHLESR